MPQIMSESISPRFPLRAAPFDRRQVLQLVGLGSLSALAACGSLRPAGQGAGASASAASILNAYRAENGLDRLAPDRQLERAALQQAGYMAGAGRMVHDTGWGKGFAARVRQNGIEGAAAENIAAGRMDLPRLFSMWMKSPPHRRNMLNARFTRFGLAYVRDANRPDWRYWTLLLGA